MDKTQIATACDALLRVLESRFDLSLEEKRALWLLLNENLSKL